MGKTIIDLLNPDIKLAGVCGLFCPACAAFIGTQEDPERLKALAEYINRSVEELECDGCRSERRSYHCENCQTRNCADEKGIKFCSECTEYPCMDLKEFQSRSPHRIEVFESLERIGEVGYEQWYREMIDHYSCPDCHTLNSAFEMDCRKCLTYPSCNYVNKHQLEIIQRKLKK